MNEAKRRGRPEVGDGVNVDDPSVERRWREGGGGAECCLPFRCPSCVQPVRERRQCR